MAAPVVKTEHVEVQLLAEREAVAAGKPAAVGLRLRMAEHWHTYWKNPGDSGLPTRIEWVLPDGWKAGEIQWPAPETVYVEPLMSYGYEGEVWLLSELSAPASLAGGDVTIGAKIDWLECKEACLPGKAQLELSLPVRADVFPGMSERLSRSRLVVVSVRFPDGAVRDMFDARAADDGPLP